MKRLEVSLLSPSQGTQQEETMSITTPPWIGCLLVHHSVPSINRTGVVLLPPKWNVMDEILKPDHSTESYSAVFSCDPVYYPVQGGSNFWVCGWNPKLWPFKAIEQYFPVVQESRAQSTHAPVLSLEESLDLCHYKEHIIIQWYNNSTCWMFGNMNEVPRGMDDLMLVQKHVSLFAPSQCP